MENLPLVQTFSNFDEFSHLLRAWNIDFRQLDSGEFRTDMLEFASSTSLLTHVRFNRLLDQFGASPPGRWTFGIFSRHSTSVIWHEQEISNDTVVVYRPGTELDSVSRPGFEVFALSYTEEHLNAICSYMHLPEVRVLLQGSDHFACSCPDLAKSRLQLHRMAEAIRCLSTEEEYTSLTHCLDFELPELILSALAGSRPGKDCRPNLRTRSIQLVKEHLAAHPGEPVTVSQLCGITRVSERTLQYAFREQYSVSPKTYLKNFRLNGARRELFSSDLDTIRVNDVASIWGFWHMGQFASDYRKLFGELPSDTLKQHKS
ncbi:MAG: hypothetical protein BA866_02225 [Desulfobulbaceae bacterium S5133MH15]|nr:MAG: hypothetical protein BA866_02225 [Desulfobulbaceae bacterium S5133MH15]